MIYILRPGTPEKKHQEGGRAEWVLLWLFRQPWAWGAGKGDGKKQWMWEAFRRQNHRTYWWLKVAGEGQWKALGPSELCLLGSALPVACPRPNPSHSLILLPPTGALNTPYILGPLLTPAFELLSYLLSLPLSCSCHTLSDTIRSFCVCPIDPPLSLFRKVFFQKLLNI